MVAKTTLIHTFASNIVFALKVLYLKSMEQATPGHTERGRSTELLQRAKPVRRKRIACRRTIQVRWENRMFACLCFETNVPKTWRSSRQQNEEQEPYG